MVVKTGIVLVIAIALLTTPADGFLKIGRKRDSALAKEAASLTTGDAKRNADINYLKDLVHDIKVLKELKAAVDASGLSTRTLRDIIYDTMDKEKKDEKSV